MQHALRQPAAIQASLKPSRQAVSDIGDFKFRHAQSDRRNDGRIHRDEACILLEHVRHRLLLSNRNTKRMPAQTSTS